MEKYKSQITGNLDIFIVQNEDRYDGEIIRSQDILIHGDPEGLKSLAMLLIKIADTIAMMVLMILRKETNIFEEELAVIINGYYIF